MSKEYRVFLTNPPLNMAETPLQYHRPLVPLGLAYLGAMLEQAFSGGAYEDSVSARLRGTQMGRYPTSGCVGAADNMRLSFYGKYDFRRLLDRMEGFFTDADPDRQFIGVSVLSDGMRAARHMLRAFRLRFPAAKIIVGGPHATVFPYDFYEDPESRQGPLADFVVRNEGEQAILAIVRREIDTPRQLCESAERLGISLATCDYSDPDYRIIDGGQYRGASSSPVGHVLDQLPVPAYFLFEEDGRLPYEPDGRYGLGDPAANINSSRGCPHHCSFCTIPKLVPGYRTLSPERMVEIVEFLNREYGVQSVFFREDNFMYAGGTLGGDRWPDVAEFCQRLLEKHLRINWAIEARADNLLASSGIEGKSRIELLRGAGLSGVYVGVESGSDVMLKLFVKSASVSEMSQALRACQAQGIAVIATALYADPDLLLKARFASVDLNAPEYQRGIVEQRESILTQTRAFLDKHEIPFERREEYAMVGIPISATYQVLDQYRRQYPGLVEHYDDASRYLYPKGFQWWSTKVYDAKRGVRPYFGYNYLADSQIRSTTPAAREKKPGLLAFAGHRR